ncbi:CIA30 family protein [Lewinellaceae bacterium SD302]|nr:CIA30 family protein [Lewinellaceae bacterium SD302]
MATPTKSDPTLELFTFNENTSPESWQVQDDVVMGGRSHSYFEVTKDGKGRFHGHVSLENNGGFASIERVLPEPADLKETNSFQLLVKGDGKTYTFRVRAEEDQNYFHQAEFPTKVSEEWETISIPYASMRAVHHGEPVDAPNFQGGRAAHLQLLIGNGKEQDFEILLAKIEAL